MKVKSFSLCFVYVFMCVCVCVVYLLKQILAGIYPVSQLREPYSSVGYLCERTNFLSVLKLTHPDHSPETPQDPKTQDWTAWDVCEGACPVFIWHHSFHI